MSSWFTDLARQYIGGEWRTGTGSWDIIDFDPYDGEKLAAITIATSGEVDEAYRAAQGAQREWAATGPDERRAVFAKALEVIEGREAEITDAITAELGGTRPRAAFELRLAEEFLRESLRMVPDPEGRPLPSSADGAEDRLYRLPVGVVGVVSPFTLPFLLAIASVAPALALGNGVVLKPHQNAPVTGGSLVARIFEEAGLPGGLLNVVITDIAEIGDAFIEHPVPSVISFTGSDETGRHVATVCAAHSKRCVLETGGPGSLVVLDDADVDHAVEAAVLSRFLDHGQVRASAGRILVHRSLEAEFTAKFVTRVRSLKVGDPRDPGTDIGPLVNSSQAEEVSAVVEQALAEGATALVRGTTTGNLVGPSVLTGLPADSALLRRDVFGPVALLVPFDTEEEAVRLVNGTPHRARGAVHTGDVGRGVDFARRIDSGTVHVNDGTAHEEPLLRLGDQKLSGVGRVGGESTVDAFTTMKWVSIRHGRDDSSR
ncbi:aldehyde dehydrogenase family protein [Streptomyces sp. NPDC048664]|uniref:aldehyde dehydrogenase family protein n=1 Tax=Streptomyces sp. NPDC048664 TaxID=3154505 RepID=UPI003432B620